VNITIIVASRFNERTALQIVAKGSHLAIVKQLLQEKANINAAAIARNNRKTTL